MTKTITYKIAKYSDKLDKATVDEGIRQGFNLWSDVTQLAFQQTQANNFDIEIEFSYTHVLFLESPMVFGEAMFDQQKIFLNNQCYWSLDGIKKRIQKNGLKIMVNMQNLPVIVAHEFGHLRGLIHNSRPNSIMKSGNFHISGPSEYDIDSMNEVLKCQK